MADGPNNRVTISDIDVSFVRLVVFFVKAALAAIPAAIIVSLILMLVGLLLRALFGFPFWGGMGGMHTL
jgi:hypothetical protein